MAQQRSEPQHMLNAYILDYLTKNGYTSTAAAFRNEANIPANGGNLYDAPSGFLFEWWSVFWDIYSARNKKHSSPEAKQYTEYHKQRMMVARSYGIPTSQAMLHGNPMSAQLMQNTSAPMYHSISAGQQQLYPRQGPQINPMAPNMRPDMAATGYPQGQIPMGQSAPPSRYPSGGIMQPPMSPQGPIGTVPNMSGQLPLHSTAPPQVRPQGGPAQPQMLPTGQQGTVPPGYNQPLSSSSGYNLATSPGGTTTANAATTQLSAQGQELANGKARAAQAAQPKQEAKKQAPKKQPDKPAARKTTKDGTNSNPSTPSAQPLPPQSPTAVPQQPSTVGIGNQMPNQPQGGTPALGVYRPDTTGATPHPGIFYGGNPPGPYAQRQGSWQQQMPPRTQPPQQYPAPFMTGSGQPDSLMPFQMNNGQLLTSSTDGNVNAPVPSNLLPPGTVPANNPIIDTSGMLLTDPRRRPSTNQQLLNRVPDAKPDTAFPYGTPQQQPQQQQQQQPQQQQPQQPQQPQPQSQQSLMTDPTRKRKAAPPNATVAAYADAQKQAKTRQPPTGAGYMTGALDFQMPYTTHTGLDNKMVASTQTTIVTSDPLDSFGMMPSSPPITTVDTEDLNNLNLDELMSTGNDTEHGDNDPSRDDNEMKELLTLVGHNSKVVACTLDVKGARLASAEHDRRLLCWDVQTGQLQLELDGHSNRISCLRFTTDPAQSYLLASCGYDHGVVKLWNCDTRQQAAVLRCTDKDCSPLSSVDFHPTRYDLICTSEHSGTLRFWNLTEAKAFTSILGAASKQARFNPVNNFLATSVDKQVRVYDVGSERLIETFNGHDKAVHTVCWSYDGNAIISASDDCVRVWKLASASSSYNTFTPTATNRVCSVIPHPKHSTRVIIASYANLHIWDWEDGKVSIIKAHPGASITCLASIRHGDVVATAASTYIKLWKI